MMVSWLKIVIGGELVLPGSLTYIHEGLLRRCKPQDSSRTGCKAFQDAARDPEPGRRTG